MVVSNHYLRKLALTRRMLITPDTRICGEVEVCNPFRTGLAVLWKQIDQNVTANQMPSAPYALTLVPAEVVKWGLKRKEKILPSHFPSLSLITRPKHPNGSESKSDSIDAYEPHSSFH